MKNYVCAWKVALIMLCLSSCRDCYYIENDLHGIWQVTSIVNRGTGEVIDPQGLLYYSFQRSMVKLGYKQSSMPESMVNYISNFDIIAQDSIGMGGFVYSSVKEDRIVPLDSLRRFGLFQEYTVFGVDNNKHELKLLSDSSLIELRKY